MRRGLQILNKNSKTSKIAYKFTHDLRSSLVAPHFDSTYGTDHMIGCLPLRRTRLPEGRRVVQPEMIFNTQRLS